MFKRRDPVAVFLLTVFVPFYSLYWLYCVAQEMRDHGTKNVPSLKMIILPIVALMGLTFGITLLANIIVSNSGSDTAWPLLINVIAVVAGVATVVNALLYYYRFSVAVYQTTHKNSPTLVFVLFLLFSSVAAAFCQSALNSVTSTSQDPTNPSSTIPGSPIS